MDRKEEKRRRILAAAEVLFADGRYHEITMEAIAQRAGVGKGTLYRYFPDKDSLFQQAAVTGYETLIRAVRAEQVSDDFRGYLLRVCTCLSDFFRRRRRLWQMMQSEEGRMGSVRGALWGRWTEQRLHLVSAVAGVLSHGVSAGVLRADIDLELMAVFLLGILRTRGRETERRPGPGVSLESALDLFLNGVLSRCNRVSE